MMQNHLEHLDPDVKVLTQKLYGQLKEFLDLLIALEEHDLVEKYLESNKTIVEILSIMYAKTVLNEAMAKLKNIKHEN